jgi:imidazolonepropionase
MAELNIVPNGAVLIRNGVIEDIGPARRVENLAGAKHAREIDATGRVVMPAFVDADMALVTPASSEKSGEGQPREDAHALRLMSRQRVQARAAAVAAEWLRYGCVTVGARTPCALDMRNIGKVLRTHQALQSKPLRIRSIFSPELQPGDGVAAGSLLEALITKWLPAVRHKKLSAVLELTVGCGSREIDISMLRTVAIAAAGLGYAIRLRSAIRLEPVHLQLAISAGAIAIVAPNDTLRAFIGPLAAIGCVRVVPASEGFESPADAASDMRRAIGEGTAIAIASGCAASNSRTKEVSSYNMQFLLYLAVDRLGLTPEEAITATTWNPACSLRLSQATGSLEPGKSADLLVMEVPDYRDLARRAGHHDLGLVMRAGKVVFRRPLLIPD